MAKDNKLRQQQAQKQSKIQSLMANFVGAGAAVAVVVIALSSSVEAYFREMFVFEDSIFYTVEVVEVYDPEEGEPQNLPIRLVIEDQFGTDIIPLEYGITTGQVNGLRKENLYKFKIQVEKEVGWITLESTSVSTYEELSGAVYDLKADDNYLSQVSDITMGIFVQNGIEVLSELYVEVTYNNQLLRYDLEYGNQEIVIEDVTLHDLDIEAVIFAQIEEGDLVELHRKTFTLRPYFISTFRFDYIDTSNMDLIVDLYDAPFNTSYLLSVYKYDDRVSRTLLRDGIESLTLEPYQKYTYVIQGRYNDQYYDILTYTMVSEAPPFALTQKLTGVSLDRLTVSVYEYDDTVFDGAYVIIDGIRYDLDVVASEGNAIVFEGDIPKTDSALDIYMSLIGQPDVIYVIETIGG